GGARAGDDGGAAGAGPAQPRQRGHDHRRDERAHDPDRPPGPPRLHRPPPGPAFGPPPGPAFGPPLGPPPVPPFPPEPPPEPPRGPPLGPPSGPPRCHGWTAARRWLGGRAVRTRGAGRAGLVG